MNKLNFRHCDLLYGKIIFKISSRNCSNVSTKRVCVVGSGPAGFYTAQHILKNKGTEVDIFEKLPVPFGLIRYGVAPDHPEIKNVTNSFTKVAKNERCKFFGNVNVGEDVKISDLLNSYHAVVLAYGASCDKSLGIPGEDSKNVLPARKFVGWYTGHPDFINEKIDLDTEVAVVIGNGNVAIDVTRILLRDIDELKKTDISEYALEALRKSRIRRVVMVGRRGPLQAAFTAKEFRQLSELSGCNVHFNARDMEGIAEIIPSLKRPQNRIAQLMCDAAASEKKSENKKSFELKFFRSPKAFVPDSQGRVEKCIFGVNKAEGALNEAKFVSTGEEDIIDCGLVLRSVGYHSSPIDSYVPFDSEKCIIPNKYGKVIGKEGLYCSGWVKSGPVGVIVSTMHSSYETGEKLLQDISKGELCHEPTHGRDKIVDLLTSKGVKYVTFEAWTNIDKLELQKGEAMGKLREKFYTVESMLKSSQLC